MSTPQEDWALLSADTGSPNGTRYVWERTGVEFALCYPNWRSKPGYSTNQIALLNFYFEEMCRLWQSYQVPNIWGALVDFARQHPDFEVWWNGGVLTFP